MRVYVVRHGESETNKAHCWTGWLDVPLTEKGIEDATKAGSLLVGVKFDKLYSSDLARATKTLETALPTQKYETSHLLREVNVGNIAGKPMIPFTEEEKALMAVTGYAAFGGETKEEFRGRVEAFMKKLEDSSDKTVGVFCHAGWQRTFLDLVIGVNLPRKSVQCNNCTVGIFEYENGQWSLHSWINV
jgi:broad specificity phosphatase PhoE